MRISGVAEAVFTAVMFSWILFAAVFLLRKKPPNSSEQQRDASSVTGIALVAIGFALVWSLRRPTFTPVLPLAPVLEMILAILTLGLCIGSIWLVLAAVRTLGKQWSMAARFVQNHELIMEGPYRMVVIQFIRE